MIKSLVVLFFYFIALTAWTQETIVTGKLSSAKNSEVEIIRPSKWLSYDYFKQSHIPILTDDKGKFSFVINIIEPEIMLLTSYDSVDSKYTSYYLFLSPGDHLDIDGDLKKVDEWKVKGRGANNNQFFKIKGDVGLDQFEGDTLPARVYNHLVESHSSDSLTLAQYIRKHKPANDFIRFWTINLRYQLIESFYSFEHNNAFVIRDAYERNYESWNQVRKNLLTSSPLINDEYLDIPGYRMLLRSYLTRTADKINGLPARDKKIMEEWYGKDPEVARKKMYYDSKQRFEQRVIEKYFTGRTKEYAYALLLEAALEESDLEDLVSVYQSFKKQFPTSEYVKLFDVPIAQVERDQRTKLTDKMIFLPDSLQSFKHLLAQFKGQTVVLDMWGTWCAPCRKEINNNSAALKEHFAGRDVRFLYVANYDIGKEKQWKELIAFFKLEGYHLLAGSTITNDIMNRVNSQEYPTYVVIDKYGNFEKSKAGYPMKREVLIAQIEAALKK